MEDQGICKVIRTLLGVISDYIITIVERDPPSPIP